MNIFKLCAAILQDFGHPKNRCWHTQLNVCEKEGFSCFLYLIQIFGACKIESMKISTHNFHYKDLMSAQTPQVN